MKYYGYYGCNMHNQMSYNDIKAESCRILASKFIKFISSATTKLIMATIVLIPSGNYWHYQALVVAVQLPNNRLKKIVYSTFDI